MGIVENRKVEIMEDRNLKMQLLNEHDACGIGAVVNIDGRKDYTVVDRALTNCREIGTSSRKRC